MAEKQFWIGSTGPFFYDDEDVYVDADQATDDIPADNTKVKAFRTEGQLQVDTPPSTGSQVLRLEDLSSGLSDIVIGWGYKLIFKDSLDADALVMEFDGTRLRISLYGNPVGGFGPR